MASSVLSERAFSAAGITISKRRNRLDADIAEALQCLKSFINQDLMTRDVISIEDEEQDLDYVDEQPVNQDSTLIKVVGAGDDLSWGALGSDDSEGILVASGHDTDIVVE
jgi:hypothetical protein